MSRHIPDSFMPRLSRSVEALAGLRFNRDRWSELRRAIERAAPELGFDNALSCGEWLESASLSDRQKEIIAGHVTVGETYLFRDRKLFDILEREILPEIIASRRNERGLFHR
ncbi:hypothetical protein ACFL2Q_19730 [Thermodesulfobacteriota bacterium]